MVRGSFLEGLNTHLRRSTNYFSMTIHVWKWTPFFVERRICLFPTAMIVSLVFADSSLVSNHVLCWLSVDRWFITRETPAPCIRQSYRTKILRIGRFVRGAAKNTRASVDRGRCNSDRFSLTNTFDALSNFFTRLEKKRIEQHQKKCFMWQLMRLSIRIPAKDIAFFLQATHLITVREVKERWNWSKLNVVGNWTSRSLGWQLNTFDWHLHIRRCTSYCLASLGKDCRQ